MYDDNYDIPGAFPAGGMMGAAPMIGGAPAAPRSGGGGGMASMFDNPQIMGALMGLSNLRDPNSMGNAIQAMMQMKQSNAMMDYRNRSLAQSGEEHKALTDYHKEQARVAGIHADIAQQEFQRKEALRKQLGPMMERFMGGQQQQPQPQPQGNPAERPEQNDNMTAPVFGNEVQGQPLPPAGQPPTPGGTNASTPQLPSPAQSGMGMDQAPPPDIVKAHFRQAIVGAEGGTNPDGSFRTSPKGAIGPGQLMPKTAPEAARLAGLPFDENKYRTDPEYNLTLSEAYHKHQFDTFGNLPMADAAYNGGPGRVLEAQNRATKMGNPNAWLSFMPQETQKYVQKTTGYSGGMVPEQLTKPAIQQAQAGQMEQWRQARMMGGYMKAVMEDKPGEGMSEMSDALKPTQYQPGTLVRNADGSMEQMPDPKFAYQQKQDAIHNALAAGKDQREAEEAGIKAEKAVYERTQRPAEEANLGARTANSQAGARKENAQAVETGVRTTGEIQKNEQTAVALEQGVKQFQDLTDGMKTKIKRLDEMGEIPNRDKDALHNLIASGKASSTGQWAGEKTGSEAAGIRNEIKNSVPLLMAALKQVAGMGATQMNSNFELETYARAAGDPTKDIQSNLEALQHLQDQYGKGAAEIRAKTRANTPGNPGAVLPPVTVPGSGTAEAPMSFEDARKHYRKQ